MYDVKPPAIFDNNLLFPHKAGLWADSILRKQIAKKKRKKNLN